jgi:hypothetical protein
MLKQAFRDESVSRIQTYEWYKRFKDGRNSIEDDPRSGRPSTSKDDQHVEKVCEVIRSDRRLTVREIADEVGILKTSCPEILTENLSMQRVAAKFVPRLLTEKQKQKRLEVSQNIFDRGNT